MDIIVSQRITPTFAQIGPLCQNGAAPALPPGSTNSPVITGSWSPSAINTEAYVTTSYTFTPDGGQCATVTTTDITVSPRITPTFAQIGPVCQNGAAPALPPGSTNTPAITGSWSPLAINTNAYGTTSYTFTPNSGACASAASMDITINPQLSPYFASIGPLCQNSAAPGLPSVSADSPSISGTWSPATIYTAAAGTTNYNFTPAADECALTIALAVIVLPANAGTTDLTVCNTELPYRWNGQTIGAAGTYRANLVSKNGCDSVATLNLSVKEVVIPVFTQIAPVLQGSKVPALDNTSLNSITGSWSPAIISTSNSGSGTYTFTPGADQCAMVATMAISVEIQAVIAEEDSLPGVAAIQIGACQQINLVASKSIGDLVSYQWSSLDQGGSLTQQAGINTQFSLVSGYSGSLPADFRVRLQVTDRNGFTNSDTLIIHINIPPVADVAVSGNLQKDGSMIVDGSVSKGEDLTYKWSASNGRIIGPDINPTAKFLGDGMYRLIITDIFGCTSTKDFHFPLEVYRIIANPDKYRITWAQDTVLHVLENDSTTAP